MSKCLHTSLPKEGNVIQKVALFSLFSQYSSCFFFFFWYLCLPPFFSKNTIFFIYSSLLHILTSHFYLTNLSLWHLSLFTSEEGGRWSLLSCELHCSGHFLINAVDRAVAHHLIRRQQATSLWKLPPLLMILLPQPIIPTWSS